MTLQTQDIDLTACEREPIHIPGNIQPHGILLAVRLSDRTIAYASANVAEVFGFQAADALGRPFAQVLPALSAEFETQLDDPPTVGNTRFVRTIRIRTVQEERMFETAISRSGDCALLELEEPPVGSVSSIDALYPTLRRFVEQLQNASSIDVLCDLAAQDVRRMTGFDRVLVYRFDDQWNGTVVAESRNEVLPSYLDLRFPASDIPAQARELYRRNRLRIIPDAGYTPVPIQSHDPAPLDLSDSVLRSVSPVHLEYMRNMGTLASMSISILREGQLWGLISCHNKDPKRVSLQVRNACDFLTQIFSLQLEARENTMLAENRVRLGAVQTRLLAHMAAEEHFIAGLVNHPDDLMMLAGAQGAAVLTQDHCWCLGQAPAKEQVRALFDWLSEHHQEDVFATDNLSEVYPAAKAFADRASGLLSISVSKVHSSYVLWFRPEVVQTVKWGGNPQKPVQEEAGSLRLHPRRSFEIWKETVRDRSLAWDRSEVEAVKELRNAIVGIVLRRAEEMASLTEELRRSNKELEAFSYSVSHDLRAPFRHIVGYSELLKKQEAGDMSEKGKRYVDTIIEAAYTAGTLVDNLLRFSHMGRTALKPRQVDVAKLVDEIRQKLSAEQGDRRIQWVVGDLVPVNADPVLIRLVFENLLDNAVKYTRTREKARIEIGSSRKDGETVYFVRDNGVGFDMKYIDKLFGVFQRLHRMEEFEGTGIGLANVRRIVERHGGRAWAEGALDKGATFSIALPDQNEGAA
ncbi:ATP-binding protein [Microvirga lotononidis]|uniref:histidine kinase n=1 Tax=Microvirga lotononidis TaxID=864069 RepID=I4YMR3_9HYPH|nr:ATP-binding protein [Microvirga lotononidis]EIM25255.1 bacteriophytochrome (light-regulated signal transduction histidine kinase) [Microvirga lotononidis]WQO29266.1 GAF domain-containing protein [Microvirga lotononidis]